ncbi:hypothetical protein D9M69_636900 [compost metagenome]
MRPKFEPHEFDPVFGGGHCAAESSAEADCLLRMRVAKTSVFRSSYVMFFIMLPFGKESVIGASSAASVVSCRPCKKAPCTCAKQYYQIGSI